MEHRDLLKDQIEQFGKALAKVLSDFLSIKAGGNTVLATEFTAERLNSQLDIDVNKILELEGDSLKSYLLKRTDSEENIERLSNLFIEFAHIHEMSDKKKARKFLNKSLDLMTIADQVSNSYSFERKSMRDSIEVDIKRLSA